MILLFGASGPGAGLAISRSEMYSNCSALFVGVALAGSLLLSRRAALRTPHGHYGSPLAIGGLLAIHPAWTITARGGDAGEALAQMSTLTSIVTALCLVGLLCHWRWGRGEPGDDGRRLTLSPD